MIPRQPKVVVTGGGGYVGRAICTQFAARGAPVVSIDMQELHADAENPSAPHPGSGHLTCDLGNRDEARVAIERAAGQLGGIDVLVCSTGVMSPDDGPTLNTEAAHWAMTFRANLQAVANSIDPAVSILRQSPFPSIVVIGSLVSSLGSASAELAYTASKGATASLVRELAVVLAADGIRVNVVAPGPLSGGLFPMETDSKEMQRIRRIPLRRRGTADEVAAAVRFLSSSEASYITGVSLAVDGGTSAAFLTAS